MVDRILSTFAVPSLKAAKGFQLTDRVNVMSAELIIIYLALEWLLDLCSENFVTLSDSFWIYRLCKQVDLVIKYRGRRNLELE